MAAHGAPRRPRPRTRRSTPTGMIVAPGIVDVHTHYDPQITFDPYATMSCFHGVTTVVAGNCGFSVAPVQAGGPRVPLRHLRPGGEHGPDRAERDHWDEFDTFPEFLASREGKLGVNFACYVGHSNLRRWVMGDGRAERGRPPPTRSSQMRGDGRPRPWRPARRACRRRRRRPISTSTAGRCRPGSQRRDELLALAEEAGRRAPARSPSCPSAPSAASTPPTRTT